MPKERPILFSGPMVRAILEGRKTMTRRVINMKPFDACDESLGDFAKVHLDECRYGVPGDSLWVRETFFAWRCKTYTDKGMSEGPEQCVYAATDGILLNGHKWKPSIHMPRWASRITLEITDVRVERVQDISRNDAVAEGITAVNWMEVDEFEKLWDSINASRGYGWDANPWVWAISFKRVEQSQ